MKTFVESVCDHLTIYVKMPVAWAAIAALRIIEHTQTTILASKFDGYYF